MSKTYVHNGLPEVSLFSKGAANQNLFDSDSDFFFFFRNGVIFNVITTFFLVRCDFRKGKKVHSVGIEPGVSVKESDMLTSWTIEATSAKTIANLVKKKIKKKTTTTTSFGNIVYSTLLCHKKSFWIGGLAGENHPELNFSFVIECWQSEHFFFFFFFFFFGFRITSTI